MAGIERHPDVTGNQSAKEWGYAQVVVAGDLVFVAGQAGQDANGQLVSAEFEPQARQAFANIERALESVGAGLSDLVATTTFLADWRYAPILAEVRKDLLGAELPTSAAIGIGQLAAPGMLIEIQSIALRPS